MQQARDEKKQNKKNLILIILLLILFFALASTAVWAFFFRDKTPMISPDYAPVESEKNAVIFHDDDSSKLSQPQGGGTVSLYYTKDVSLSLSEKKAYLDFANPRRSNQNMVVQVWIHDQVVVQSDLITPGHQVKELPLLTKIPELSEGQYDGKISVLFYQDDTGEKAMVNTDIPVTVRVTP